MSDVESTLSGQCTAQACLYTSLAEANFLRGQPRQSQTHGQLASTSSSTALAGSIAGIIWIELGTGAVVDDTAGVVTAGVAAPTAAVDAEEEGLVAVEVVRVEALGATGVVEGSDVEVAVEVVVVEETGVEEVVVVFEEVVLPFGGTEAAETAGSTDDWGCGVGLAVTVADGVTTGVAGFGGAATFC